MTEPMSERAAGAIADLMLLDAEARGFAPSTFPDRYSDAWVILRTLHSPNAPFTTGQLHEALAGEMTGERLVAALASLVETGRVCSEIVEHLDRLAWRLTEAGKAEWIERWSA